MYYLILIGTIIAFLGSIFIIHRFFPNKEKLIVERIFVFVLMGLFAFRFMSYRDVQFENANYKTFMLFGGPMNGFLNTIGNLCLWLEVSAALMIFLRPWSHFKTAKFYVKFIALPILLVSAIALNPMLKMMQGDDSWTLLTILLPIEIGGLLSVAVYYLAKDFRVKISKHSYTEVILFSIFCIVKQAQPKNLLQEVDDYEKDSQ